MLTVLGIVVGLVVLPILINMDYGGSIGNTFNAKLTQSQKARRYHPNAY